MIDASGGGGGPSIAISEDIMLVRKDFTEIILDKTSPQIRCWEMQVGGWGERVATKEKLRYYLDICGSVRRPGHQINAKCTQRS